MSDSRHLPVIQLDASSASAPENDTAQPRGDVRPGRTRVPGLARPRTLNPKRASKRALAAGRLEFPVVAVERPRTRGDCLPGGINVERPCPFASCKYHLYLDVSISGGLRFNFPDRDLDEISDTCALDVADRGGLTHEAVGENLNVVRERVRQIEQAGLARMRAHMHFEDLSPETLTTPHGEPPATTIAQADAVLFEGDRMMNDFDAALFSKKAL